MQLEVGCAGGQVPEDRDARLAFLEGWAKSQQRRLASDEETPLYDESIARVAAIEQSRLLQHRRLASDEQRRPYAEQIARVVARARRRVGQADSLREVAVIPVVITKPSDLPVDRAAVFADLMVRLREYKWADPIVSECDEPRYIAPKAIDLARRHRPDAPWLLYMEDDVIPGPDFGLLPGLLREADELFPDTGVVSFFTEGCGEPGWSTHPMPHFGWLQCAAIRNTDYLVGFRTVIDDGVTERAAKQFLESPDMAVRLFLAVEYDAYALWCPSLVQHAEVTSAFLGPVDASGRISLSYKQAYG